MVQIKGSSTILSYLLSIQEDTVSVKIYKPEAKYDKNIGVIFLQGFPAYQKNIDIALNLSLLGITTCTFDYPGTWQSKGKFHPLVGIETTREVKEFFLEQMAGSINRWGIFGHSWGATLALLYVSQDKSCSSTACLSIVNNLLSITGGTTEGIVKMFIEDSLPLNIEIDKNKLKEDLTVIASEDILEDAVKKNIDIPVLLLHGLQDTDVSKQQSERVVKLSNDKFRIKLLPDEGHNPKNRESLTAILSDWFTNTLLNKQ